MSVEDTAAKIRSMEVRGAGKIARAVAQAMKEFTMQAREDDPDKLLEALATARDALLDTRPTAVSLANSLDAVMKGATGDSVSEIKSRVVSAADKFISNSIHAIETITDSCSSKINHGDTIITHCNSSVAVKSIIKAHDQGKKVKVYSTETRPWLQGHITSQALANAGVDTTLIVDSAVRFFMAEANIVIIGADTITADGSVINKIGTSQIALCAHEQGVPVYVCAETYKFSKSVTSGAQVIIEERDHAEVVTLGKLKGVKVRNPVFDTTPPEYIKAIITERCVIRPDDANKIILEMF